MEALSLGYIHTDQKFVRYLYNPIVENAMYHTYNSTLDNPITVDKEDFKEVLRLVHPHYKQRIVRALFNMQRNNVGYVFWIEEDKICFE